MAHSFSRNFILKKLSENKVIRSYINNSLAIRGAILKFLYSVSSSTQEIGKDP